MENFSQVSKVSSIENQMKSAAEYVNDAVKQLTNNDGVSGLEAAKKVYEEVKGHDYRKEQVVAKLLELLSMRKELDMRTQEMARYSSELASLDPGIHMVSAGNDERYTVAA